MQRILFVSWLQKAIMGWSLAEIVTEWRVEKKVSDVHPPTASSLYLTSKTLTGEMRFALMEETGSLGVSVLRGFHQ